MLSAKRKHVLSTFGSQPYAYHARVLVVSSGPRGSAGSESWSIESGLPSNPLDAGPPSHPSYYLCSNVITSLRVLASDRQLPRTAEVTITLPAFLMPRQVMQVCVASITTATPLA